MQNKDKKGYSGSKPRYAWDPNKLAWVERVDEPAMETPVSRDEPVRREGIIQQEGTVSQPEAVRQEALVHPFVEEGTQEVEVEAEAYEAELDTSFLEYRGALLRLIGIVIDVIILSVVGVIISMIARAVGPDTLPRAYGVINLFIGFAYFVGFWLWRGQTPGKMIIRAKVVKPDGSSIELSNAVLRYIVYFVPTFAPLLFIMGFFGVTSWLQIIIPLISLIVIAFVPKKRGIHDMIAGTVVINTRSKAFLPPSTEDFETYESESETKQQE